MASIISDFTYCDPCYCSVVCLPVTFAHCARTAEDTNTISFAYDSAMSLPDRIKIWLTSVNPFLPKLGPKVSQFNVDYFGPCFCSYSSPAKVWQLLLNKQMI